MTNIIHRSLTKNNASFSLSVINESSEKFMKNTMNGWASLVPGALVLSALVFAPALSYAADEVKVQPGPQTPPAPQVDATKAPKEDKSTPKIVSGQWTGAKLPDGQPDITGYWGATFGAYLNLTDPEGYSSGERPRKLGPREERAPSRVSDPADGHVPFQPWALAKVKEYQTYYPNPIRPEFIDPLARCAPSGIPQSLYMHGHEIYQYPGYIVFIFDQGTRVIHLDGKPHLPESIKLWNGDSRGHWEGNTLVVDVGNYNGKSKYGRTGEFISENGKIQERYIFDNDGKRYNYVASITDPAVYTQPITVTVPIRKYTDKDKPKAVVYAVRLAKHSGPEAIYENTDERTCIEFNSGHAHLSADDAAKN
jgi:hypothetical protein